MSAALSLEILFLLRLFYQPGLSLPSSDHRPYQFPENYQDPYHETFLDGCDLNIFDEDTCTRTPIDKSDQPPKIDKRTSIRCRRWLWPDRTIPYRITLKDPVIIDRFYEAIEDLNKLGCVSFDQLIDNHETDNLIKRRRKFLMVREIEPMPGRSCQATLGTTGRYPRLDLSSVCTKGQILHELMHVLGFVHEHQRPDRDQYVKVKCEHLMPNVTQDFRRLRSHVINEAIDGDHYDFKSIMHYRLDHFSIDGQRTLEPIDPEYLRAMGIEEDDIGRMVGLSKNDVRRIRVLYQC